MAKALGIRCNATGRLLDMCAGLIAAYAKSYPQRRSRGYGELPVESVRAIRRSKSKIASIAVEHGISEAMVCKIRSRLCYRWVR